MRRASSSSPPSSPRPAKRQRTEHLTSESFKNGVMLAPMVRSGSLPTRLYALKHGATLVWSPEVVDKAILHSERVVDPQTGVISYNGVSKAIFATHPIEKPYLIYQIGSASPDLAVQAAKTVMQDVSGVDLNCGCPKPFSTHSGMGAALLSNPDLLCSILTALRRELPPEITVSAKIRLLPTQEETLKLVEQIVNTGISTLTVHCRTRNMRPRERALIGRLREVVEFVEKMGKGVAVIENGDCVSREDAIRIRDITGAHSCMIATAAESNPTCFSPTPLTDLAKTFSPKYIQLGKYLDNHFGSTKFCALSFKGALKETKRAERQEFRTILSRAKSYDDLNEFVGELWNGEEELWEIAKSLESRVNGALYPLEPPPPRPAQEKVTLEDGLVTSSNTVVTSEASVVVMEGTGDKEEDEDPLSTPPDRENPEPASLNAPLLPTNERRMTLPSLVSGREIPTPSPSPAPKPCNPVPP
ncbi:FMN-linked oxidoreductase [Phellopilus nigrolimitatus]|nr:FMN-linked oxidoreductase [Phellopilus nigrolimitatus]